MDLDLSNCARGMGAKPQDCERKLTEDVDKTATRSEAGALVGSVEGQRYEAKTTSVTGEYD